MVLGAAGGTAGGEGLGSGTRAGSKLVTRSVNAATWLDREDRAVEVDSEAVLNAPISPVTWAKADVSSVFNLVSCAEWLRTTVSRPDWPGVGISVPIGCLGRPGSIKNFWLSYSVTAQKIWKNVWTAGLTQMTKRTTESEG